MSRIEREKNVISLMIKLYCNKKHKTKKVLCHECQELLEYAHKRLNYCKFGEKKNACGRCTSRCYKPEMSDKIRAVMRFSGSRLIIYKPFEFFRHILR